MTTPRNLAASAASSPANTTSPASPAGPGLSTVLRNLRVGLHVMFCALLILGAVRVWLADDTAHAQLPVVLLVAAALGLVYAGGIVVEYRARRGVGSFSSPTVNQQRSARWWWAAVVVLWLSALVLANDFLWVLFPLVFVTLAVLPRSANLPAAAVLWAAGVAVVAWLHPQHWHIAVAIGPGIGTVFAVAIYVSYRALHREALTQRRIAEELAATQQELAATEHQAGRLEERERLARDIHDTLAQGLSSIVLLARAGRASASTGEAASPEHKNAATDVFSTIEDTARDNLAEARRFVRDLTAPSAQADLPDAITEILQRMRRRGSGLGESTEFRANFSGDTHRRLPESVVTAVVRCVQEALNNVAKHAHADHAVVSVAVLGDELTVDIFDDGRGFDPARAPQRASGHGYGLSGIQQRIAALSGTVNIESAPGEGTVVAARIPLTSQHTPAS
ncbi:sensor histidine kinase [Corynebacterium pseudodiphtheriticum]|uniref:sensor histidine kinase n=1 Tax=Corynebacterium pseudodiphtheriticum TaxID=37637 RepID=UPI00223B1392|nr:sensor histidine kinase [Corynebacterium pseudodiphtheriticum]MCT1636079.1 sensor histidine kinase [Corynebacterium pseudodiphtheriticum]MCT1667040.1 sensor histidine kinase [Corynebacterium pseudodiphtheriticum]MDC7088742.1 sensor histidine kinase [Corynebacterium pseudodiphtheriticum]